MRIPPERKTNRTTSVSKRRVSSSVIARQLRHQEVLELTEEDICNQTEGVFELLNFMPNDRTLVKTGCARCEEEQFRQSREHEISRHCVEVDESIAEKWRGAAMYGGRV